jgi:hypothetical protein
MWRTYLPSKFNPAAPVVLTDPPAIIETIKEENRAETVIQEAISLDAFLEANQFVLGDLFAEIIDNGYLAAAGVANLAEFLKQHNFKLSKREIIYRTKISRVSKSLGIDNALMSQAGVSKVKKVFELDHTLEVVNDEDNTVIRMADIMVELVTRAANGRSLKEIASDVDALKSKEEKEEEYVDWKLRITKLQLENFEQVIEMGRMIHGDTVNEDEETSDASKERIIELIFEDWKSDPNNQVDEDGLHAPVSQFEDEAALVVDGEEIETGF